MKDNFLCSIQNQFFVSAQLLSAQRFSILLPFCMFCSVAKLVFKFLTFLDWNELPSRHRKVSNFGSPCFFYFVFSSFFYF